MERSTYKDNVLEGEKVLYQSDGSIRLKEVYFNGKVIERIEDKELKGDEQFPVFGGCEKIGLSESATKACSDERLIKFLYTSLKYPKKARRLGIEGKAILQFVVTKTGTVEKIKVLNGLSKDIANVCIELIESMPTWNPGVKDGVPVNVLYTLPVTFQLL